MNAFSSLRTLALGSMLFFGLAFGNLGCDAQAESSGTGGSGGSGGDQNCTPGENNLCYCAGDAQGKPSGVQTCDANGDAYSACDCPSNTGGSGGSTSSSGGAGGGTSTGTTTSSGAGGASPGTMKVEFWLSGWKDNNNYFPFDMLDYPGSPLCAGKGDCCSCVDSNNKPIAGCTTPADASDGSVGTVWVTEGNVDGGKTVDIAPTPSPDGEACTTNRSFNCTVGTTYLVHWKPGFNYASNNMDTQGMIDGETFPDINMTLQGADGTNEVFLGILVCSK